MKSGGLRNKISHKGAIVALLCMIFVLSAAITVHSDENRNIVDRSSGTICGVVTDSGTNMPIQEAKLILEYHETIEITYTDSTGHYKFTDVPMCFCLKNVTASKKGYESQSKMVAVYKVTCVNFELKSDEGNGNSDMGTIMGYVTDSETEEPIPDALIILEYHEIVRKQYTDSEGYYFFDSVPGFPGTESGDYSFLLPYRADRH